MWHLSLKMVKYNNIITNLTKQIQGPVSVLNSSVTIFTVSNLVCRIVSNILPNMIINFLNFVFPNSQLTKTKKIAYILIKIYKVGFPSFFQSSLKNVPPCLLGSGWTRHSSDCNFDKSGLISSLKFVLVYEHQYAFQLLVLLVQTSTINL